MEIADIPGIVAALRSSFESGRTRSLSFRVAQLKALKAMLTERESEFHDALRADLGKPKLESWVSETGFTALEIDHALKHVGAWTKPESVSTPLTLMPGKSRIVPEPLGVTLIIGPWNYPLQLLTAPLVAAIAAGNCALVKPSEMAPRTSAKIAELFPKYLDSACFRVVETDVAGTTKLLEEQFDLIFFTGSTAVGRVVMTAAAKHLTPVVLELGGKSPCIVSKDANLDVAARRIVWGKFFNTGQTCIAPDYVLVDRQIEEELLRRMREKVIEFYGASPKRSADYGHIINARHHKRLSALLSSIESEGAEIVCGGEIDEEKLYISPTIIRNVPPTAKVMEDEIFGPILPVLSVDSAEDAIRFVNARPKPLALYVFTSSNDVKDRVVARTSSGGVCVNHCLYHYSVPDLPFGGVGPSGMGAYHGKSGFDAFSHRKGVFDKAVSIEPPLLYPPYTDDNLKWARRLTRGTT